jgi:hypothetical protein
VDAAAFDSLHAANAGDHSLRARLLSCSGPGAGGFLTAIPTRQNRLEPRSFSAAVRLRLGMRQYGPVIPDADVADLVDAPRLCPCCLRANCDPLGHHSLICQSTSDRALRHNSLRDVVWAAARSAAVPATREAPHVIPGSAARPADVLLRGWSSGRDAALDLVVTSPVAQTYVQRSSGAQGLAARLAEDAKLAGAGAACAAAGVEFLPLAVEVFGCWGAVASRTLRHLAWGIAERSGRPRAEEHRYLLERLSVALQRGNAAMLLQRAPESVRVRRGGAEPVGAAQPAVGGV